MPDTVPANDRAAAMAALSVDVEDWFHILDSPAVPGIEQWDNLESRVSIGMYRLLETFERHRVKATMFWLGWVAQRHKGLVRQCVELGHEIASHGYAHLLPYQVGIETFRNDAVKSKAILEDIVGCPVRGFRAAGFGATSQVCWVFDVLRGAGYEYDSSVFPAPRGHGGNTKSALKPYLIRTEAGDLLEFPMSVINLPGRRVPLFGGGYLRLAPKWLVQAGIWRLKKQERMLLVYVHPREADADHPRLPLSFLRRFKCYVNLAGMMGKIEWLCRDYRWSTMGQLAHRLCNNGQLPYCDRLLAPLPTAARGKTQPSVV